MGVPGFFSWILKKRKSFDKIILHKLNTQIDILYLDANCLFHPQCQQILTNEPLNTDINDLENKMIIQILKYIELLITYTKPSKYVYISVDGVAPLAKMNQQRYRRYKTKKENEQKATIKKKHNINVNTTWNSSSITPGTLFMEKLHKAILKYLNDNNTIKYIYSSYHSPSEGEHKILKHIKNLSDENNTFIIYGLDADLIFLALASQKKNIYLLREKQTFNNVTVNKNKTTNGQIAIENSFLFVSIDLMKECYSMIIMDQLNIKYNELLNTRLCNDFIFLCYFLGNDFLPHLPSINIKKGGLDLLINLYTHILSQLSTFATSNLFKLPITIQYLIDIENKKINNIFIKYLIFELNNDENNFFYQNKHITQYRYKCNFKNQYEKELWEFDNMVNFQIDNPIQLGSDNPISWKYRYYNHYFKINKNDDEFINKLCEYYLNTICWCFHYYFYQCPDWSWHYPFAQAPFISDLYKYICDENYDFNNVVFNDTSPVSALTQLVTVLPPWSNYLLPENYKHLSTSISSPILDLYPENFKLDMIYKDMYWQCIPMLPLIDFQRVKKTVSVIKNNEQEQILNEELPVFSNV
jgi:5'-3' exoribonuclease 1